MGSSLLFRPSLDRAGSEIADLNGSALALNLAAAGNEVIHTRGEWKPIVAVAMAA